MNYSLYHRFKRLSTISINSIKQWLLNNVLSQLLKKKKNILIENLKGNKGWNVFFELRNYCVITTFNIFHILSSSKGRIFLINSNIDTYTSYEV